MSRNLWWAVVTVLVLGLFAPANAEADAPSEHLRFLEPLIGVEWIGHYADEETAHFRHVVTWEWAHDGHVVRMLKEVEELSFTMETLYYWDADAELARYVSVTNRGQVSSGRASATGDTIDLLGYDLTADGRVAYRYTFCVTDGGVLEDRFWRPDDAGWEERHLILCDPSGGEAGTTPSD